MKPMVKIEYCPECGWMLRAAYIAQELLTTFTEELGGVALVPSPVSGRFQLWVDASLIFDRKENGGFADIKWFKTAVRDLVAPDKPLGHSEKKV